MVVDAQHLMVGEKLPLKPVNQQSIKAHENKLGLAVQQQLRLCLVKF